MAADLGSNLPNLKITVGNDSTEQETSQDNADLPEQKPIVSKQMDVQVVRKITPAEGFRVYENKGGAFVTGLDLSSEIVTKKLADRAARFGPTDHPKTPVTQTEIDALYKSLDINPEEGKTKNIRLDALHMRGVEEMNTNEVIEYFKEFGPALVEWINDFSCNVVWLDNTGPARALLGLSRIFVLKKKSNAANDSVIENKEEPNKDDTCAVNVPLDKESEEVIFMSDLSSDEDDDENDDTTFKRQNNSNPSTVEDVSPMEVCPAANDEADEKSKEDSGSPVDVPVPPGHWRLGVPHEKAKAILLRFASRDDKKLPGAERRSTFYQKYGNPNYGGMTGLISKTRKRKINATKQRQVVEQLSGKSDASAAKIDNKPKRVKRLRMCMVADEEEEKIRARRLRNVEEGSRSRNVHDRLGGEPFFRSRPSQELDEFHSDDEDELWPNTVRSIASEPPSEGKLSRFRIWNRLAASMAEESDTRNTSYRSISPDRRRKDVRSRLGSTVARPSNVAAPEQGDLRSKLLRKRDHQGNFRSPMLTSSQLENDR